MRGLLLPALMLLLAFPLTWGRYDDFDDGEELAEFDDNDFAEFEDMSEDVPTEAETAPPPRAPPAATADQDDEDEATVELEDGQDDFEDSETPDEDMYNKYDAEEFEGFEKSNPPFKDPINILTVRNSFYLQKPEGVSTPIMSLFKEIKSFLLMPSF